MRASAVLCLMIALCVAAQAAWGGGERVRVQSFMPGPGGTFTYSVQTNTVMAANEDSGAEAIRRNWLAETLGAAGMCNGGYVIYRRELVVPPQRPALIPAPPGPANADTGVDFGNTGLVVYSGSCL